MQQKSEIIRSVDKSPPLDYDYGKGIMYTFFRNCWNNLSQIFTQYSHMRFELGAAKRIGPTSIIKIYICHVDMTPFIEPNVRLLVSCFVLNQLEFILVQEIYRY